MIDINTLISNALIVAVQEATKPLVERIEALQTNCAAYEILFNETRGRIAALENNPAIGVDTTLEQRITALEGSKQISADAFVTHLDQQEWFWDKLARFVVNNGGSVVADDLAQIKERITAIESETQGENRYLNRDDVSALIEEAMDEHTSNYDHDDYDNHIQDDDKHFDGDIEQTIRDTVCGMTFEIR